MSFRGNVTANYAAQIYTTLIGIVTIPFYVAHMGSEAYGLVGIYSMLQTWFQLLDVGLSATVSREAARFNGGSMDGQTFRRLVKGLQSIFFGTGAVGSLALFLAAPLIATHWLKPEHLSAQEIGFCLRLMALVIGLRWVCGLYRATISGLEQQIWLSAANSAIATMRFVFVIPVLIFIDNSAHAFFIYQAFSAVVEALVLHFKVMSALPARQAVAASDAPSPLRAVIKFSLSVAFINSVWIFVTQTDKLVLSKLIPLSDYGYFSMAVLLAGGITIMTGPISSAFLPRISRLQATGDDAAVLVAYRQATRLVATIILPIAAVLFFFPQDALFVWTGNHAITNNAAPILRLYALGNGVLAVAAFPYYMQYAKGDLKLHIMGNVVFVVVLVPLIIVAAQRGGAVGAGYVWAGVNIAYLLGWTPLVHRRFYPALHARWLLLDIAPYAIASFALPAIVAAFVQQADTRLHSAVAPIGAFVVALSACLLLLNWQRRQSH